MNGKMAFCLTAAGLFVAIPVSIGHAKTTLPQSPLAGSQNQTFIGEVTRSSDSRERQTPLILYDETRKMNYFLDNNGNKLQLGQYYDREVQVTGTLNRAGDTIRAVHQELVVGFIASAMGVVAACEAAILGNRCPDIEPVCRAAIRKKLVAT